MCFLYFSQDVKPGVSMVRRVKESIKKEIKQKEANTKNRQKTFKEQEKESREAALQNSISTENKGFALLQKMGYKFGQGLGKQGKCLPHLTFIFNLFLSLFNFSLFFVFTGAGRVDPIPLNIKAGSQYIFFKPYIINVYYQISEIFFYHMSQTEVALEWKRWKKEKLKKN